MADQSKGLPMTAKWDPEKLNRDIAELDALEKKPFLPRAGGYIKRTGPGLLQSAMTLGAGSATASVVAGASFGYKLLWVQPVAMFLGVMMLAALANVVLTTGERPYKSFGREIGKTLVILWALGTIMSSVIWHFPQYGLAAGAARDLGTMAQVETDVSFLKLADGTYLTKAKAETVDLVRAKVEAEQPVAIQTDATKEQWEAAKKTKGAESTSFFTSSGLAISFGVGLLILGINIFTVFSYGSSPRGIKIYEWFLRTVIGLIILMFAIVVVSKIGSIDWAELGKGFIGWYGIPEASNPKHITLVLGMLGAAVGINMTFLYPYSLLAKGWGKHHKKLARWDLGMSMFLPFTLVTSLVIVAMSVTGIYSGQDILREGLKPVDAAGSLSGVLGDHVGRIVFDLGLIAMTCTAISTHMVVCGFTLCEMFGLEYTKTRFRLFALAPSIGILGVVAALPFWFPVAASAICFAMLPIAYLAFLIMNNRRSYIGEAVGRGPGRVVFNAILVVALAMATIGSIIQINNRVIQNEKVRAFFGLSVAQPADQIPADSAPEEKTTETE
ncbi:MAG: divalent metal cation transporter [Pirellulales bacterium]|nr:divalent metal cation transporter [Pirellulales bacterium]